MQMTENNRFFSFAFDLAHATFKTSLSGTLFKLQYGGSDGPKGRSGINPCTIVYKVLVMEANALASIAG